MRGAFIDKHPLVVLFSSSLDSPGGSCLLIALGGHHRLFFRVQPRLLMARLIVAGLTWPWLRRLPLFHLPGDIVIDRPGFKFFFPLTTMLLVSVVISVLSWLLRR